MMDDEGSTLFADISGKLPEHVDHVSGIAQALMAFHEARETTYQMSFAKRGEVGVWMNLGRKTDRINVVATHVFEAVGAGNDLGNDGVTLVDTLADIVVYALKWMDVIARTRPDDFQGWVSNVFCKDTGMEFGTAMRLFGVSPQVKEIEATYPFTWTDEKIAEFEAQNPPEVRKDKADTLRKKKIGPYVAHGM